MFLFKRIAIVEDDVLISVAVTEKIKKEIGITPDAYPTFADLGASKIPYDLLVLDNNTGEDVHGVEVARKHPTNAVLYTSDCDVDFDPRFDKSDSGGLVEFIKSFFGK
jgi:hypothetical protein